MKRIRFFPLLLFLCFLFSSCTSKSIYKMAYHTGDEVSGLIVSVSCQRKWKRGDKIELIIGFGRDRDIKGYETTILSIEASDFVIEDCPGYYDYEITDLEDHKYIWPTMKKAYQYQKDAPPCVKTITLSVPEDTKNATGSITIGLHAYYGPTARRGTSTGIRYTIDERYIVFK